MVDGLSTRKSIDQYLTRLGFNAVSVARASSPSGFRVVVIESGLAKLKNPKGSCRGFLLTSKVRLLLLRTVIFGIDLSAELASVKSSSLETGATDVE